MNGPTLEEIQGREVVALRDEAERAGITIQALLRKLKAELNAKEVKAFKAKVAKKEGRRIVVVEDVIYSKPLVAWEIRQRARMDAQALLGLYPQAQGLQGRFVIDYQVRESSPPPEPHREVGD